MAGAACRGMGTDLFFPAPGDDLDPAKALCARCPVREPCLDYALSSVEGGAAGRDLGRDIGAGTGKAQEDERVGRLPGTTH